MIKLAEEALARSPEETARRLCLLLLEEAEKALERMERGENGEALHDFRVALRRTRSVLRAYRPFLKGSRPRKLRRLVSSLASSTNVARDVDVQLAYLREEEEGLEEPARSASSHLRHRLESKRGELPSVQELRRSFDAARKTANHNLARMRLELGRSRERFASATGRLIQEHGESLRKRLEAVESARDVDGLHRARIAAKRLRYLLEPLQRELGEARPLIKRMKSLQDELGDLQDTRVLTEAIGTALESAALEEARALRELALSLNENVSTASEARQSPQRTGLLALLELQRQRRDQRFQELASGWMGEAGRAFFDEVGAFGKRLEGETETAPRRRFLLRGLPEPLRGVRPERLRLGWLPGRKVVERIESRRAGRHVNYRRVVTGENNAVLEEPLTRSSFHALWTLTDGRRIELERYGYVDGETRFVVSVCGNLGIVLAEAELPEDASLPEWLATDVRREVTGSERYEPFALARRRPGKSS
jgi:CHAD domain-containing protein/CYTH domain-containing protein